jgi:predicted CXXCH cytochrome family protein
MSFISKYRLAVLLLAAAVAAPWVVSASVGAGVDQGEVCLDCHDDIASALALPVEHPPAKAADCSSCHNPHAARDANLLLDRPAILCVGCHADVAEQLGRPFLHQPVAEGRCTGCHEAHGGSHANLLVAPGTDLCEGCHEDVAAWGELSNQHSPFRRGRCADCHEPHGSEHERLQTKAGGEVCSSCHPVSAKFRSDHGGYPVERANCQQCHDPHASQQAGLLQPVAHEPFADGDCTLCHVAASSAAPFVLRVTQDELCGDCHEDAVEENRSAAFPHVSAGGARCSACHNPHGGQDRSLLHRETNELCLSCHDPGGGSAGGAGHFQTHSDLDCDTCHSPHGGDRPLLMVDNSVELCGMCHSHQHAITHPMGEAALDPRNGQPLDCLSCHGIHEAPAEKYLHRDGSRDLCVGCHKSKGVPR